MVLCRPSAPPCLEIRCIPPEFNLFKVIRIVQSHHQCRIDLSERPGEAVGNEDVRVIAQLRPVLLEV